ncbi:Type 1 glutamine amidotransferase-like domain-containing protein [Clostridium sp. UBA6640]|uniref:Type 1 glutamine amidotransferase-like domain-containing protein n=1 Tax=Clostridium sp. UBA6640 TaxID=1946370 RepID=UPI0025C46C7B|nr:Type 1 glutamine amidotransferase-like domain-containing protein [Clostridium sp. UBA6640]
MNIKKIQDVFIDRGGIEVGEFYMKKFVMVSGVDPNTNLDFIDEEIIRITSKSNPKILFIPTASGDDINYCNRYKSIYEEKFKCSLDVLYLFTQSPKEQEIRNKIFTSDIVYIGGGSTVRLMECFNKFNMKDILTEAIGKGVVLAGISAGSICLGKYYFYEEESKNFEADGFEGFVKVDCLGFLKLLIFPHNNLEDYSEMINAMVRKHKILGIALDNNCALEIVDDTYRIITSKEGAKAYAFYLKEGELVKKIIEKKHEFNDIKQLMNLN